MRIFKTRSKKDYIDIPITFPIFRKIVSDKFTIYYKIIDPDTMFEIWDFLNGKMSIFTGEKPSWIGDFDYLLGNNQYGSSKEEFSLILDKLKLKLQPILGE